MAGKKRFVDGDILHPHRPLACLYLKNAVYQQKRVAMRNDLLNFLCSKHRAAPFQ
ncbi:hypothetical protein D3C73_1432780 [compost metagenome]